MTLELRLGDDTVAAVEKGAAWLDEYYPGWADKVNVEILDLGNSCHCVLGQLLGSEFEYSEIIPGALIWSDLHPLGFSLPACLDDDDSLSAHERAWGELTGCWTDEIEWRQS